MPWKIQNFVIPSLLGFLLLGNTEETERLSVILLETAERSDLLHSNTYEMVEFVLFRMYLCIKIAYF